jgi:CBS domain-containing protein
MSKNRPDRDDVRIGDLVSTYSTRAVPMVRKDTLVKEIVEVLARSPRCRLVYVVGDRDELLGAVSLGSLIRHLYSPSHEPKLHARDIINVLGAETAGDIMKHGVVSATADEQISQVIAKVIAAGVKEFPVLDENSRVIGDLTIVDLMHSESHQDPGSG